MELYGFGARKMGRAGEGVALADGTESILSNPAALAGIPHAELSAGFLISVASFTPVPDVWSWSPPFCRQPTRAPPCAS